VELVHLDRRIAEARTARTGGVAELVARRARVEERLNENIGASIEEGRPA
jgi:hypothetical protein